MIQVEKSLNLKGTWMHFGSSEFFIRRKKVIEEFDQGQGQGQCQGDKGWLEWTLSSEESSGSLRIKGRRYRIPISEGQKFFLFKLSTVSAHLFCLLSLYSESTPFLWFFLHKSQIVKSTSYMKKIECISIT